MLKKLVTLVIGSLIAVSLLASPQIDSLGKETPIVLKTNTGEIMGTLLLSVDFKKGPLALIIAGSGPTDRNGNSSRLDGDNNSLKMLAEGLSKEKIASVRYDKRGVAGSEDAASSEKEMRFEMYVNDATGWIKLLKQDKRFTKIIVIGHSEGSLIGMIAAKNANADQYISVAGAGKSADKILKDQFNKYPEEPRNACYTFIDSLVAGKTIDDVPAIFQSVFRPSIQPYMISWFKYDPQTEIKKLSIPILILQGTTDLQVSVENAELLSKAQPKARLVIIEGINHVLKEAPMDKEKNMAAYSDPTLPLKQEFVYSITTFINEK